METKKRIAKVQKSSYQKASKNGNRLWESHGLDDVYYQSETQVDFWSILGGMVGKSCLAEHLIPEYIEHKISDEPDNLKP
jgi:hypothetical protein